MKLIITNSDQLISLIPAQQIRGAEQWELASVAESAFHLIDNEDDRVLLKEAALNGREITIGNISMRRIKLHSNDGQMKYEDHLAIHKVVAGNSVTFEVSDAKQAHEKCKELSVIKDSAGKVFITHGVTMRQSSKRDRLNKRGVIETCGTHNPFTQEFISNSSPIIATFISNVIYGVLIA